MPIYMYKQINTYINVCNVIFRKKKKKKKRYVI